MSEAKQRIVTELKVSGHLMTLDPGVFCVFQQDAPPLDDSHLPGVRISMPPGPDAGVVSIRTFRDDGWLGGADSAALIRVSGRAGQVLVTVYQSPTGGDAPKLQVVRLTEVPGEPPAPTPVARPQISADAAEVAAHVNRVGDVLAMIGDWVGERGSQRWIEGFAVAPKHSVGLADLEYQAVLGRDWLSPWSEGGQYCGSRGMSLPLLGLRVRLRGAAADTHDATLEASFVNGQVMGPVDAGTACETDDLSALEAFRLTIRPRTPAAATTKAGPAKVTKPAASAARNAPRKPASPRRR